MSISRVLLVLAVAVALVAVAAAADPPKKEAKEVPTEGKAPVEAKEERYYPGQRRHPEYNEDSYYRRSPHGDGGYYPWLDPTGVPYVNFTIPGVGCKPGTQQWVERHTTYNVRAYQRTWCSDSRTATSIEIDTNYDPDNVQTSNTVNPFIPVAGKDLVQVGGACWFDQCVNWRDYETNHLNEVTWITGTDDGDAANPASTFTTCNVNGPSPSGDNCRLVTVAVCCERADDIVKTVPVVFPHHDY